MTSFTKFLLTIVAALGLVPRWATQDDGRVDLLLAGLGSPGTVESLVKLGQSDPEGRRAIAKRLPSWLAKDPPRDSPLPPRRWADGFKVAGELKIVEAVPAHQAHGHATHAESGLSSSYEFRNRAAVQALIEIGQPAVPAVVERLRHGDPLQRQASAYIPSKIGGDIAQQALKDVLPSETDPLVRRRIDEARQPRKPSS